ncbi:MAG TPA: 3-oxoadipate enol-lactonase [Candidatus Acidoferrum sp.]|jgi:3-oxoadipate enol-lactonase
MPTVKLPDAELYYEFSGPEGAPILVLSNSLGTNLHIWDGQIADFTKHFRLLRYDTRGHGKSSVTPGPYSLAQLSNDVLHLLDALQLSQVYFCGVSMGGMTAMFLGIHSPSRFNKIVACSAAAKIGTPESWNARIDAVKKDGMKAVASAVIERWFTLTFRTTHPAEMARMQAILENANPDGYIANCAAVRDMDLRDSLTAINIPALIISGTYDPGTTPADGRYLAEHIPVSRFFEIAASHISNIEAQIVFNREVLSFLLA